MTTNRSWVLAVDFGTTNTVAAVVEAGGLPRVLQVDGAPTMPSSVYLDSEPGAAGPRSWLTGRAADASALVDPSRYEPSPKRAVGAGTVFLGGTSIDVVDPVAAVLRHVFGEASRQHDNTAPAVLLLTHPALWRGERLRRLATAAEWATAGRGWPVARLLAEPVAAARHAARARHLPPVCRFAVLDLGGGTCDVAVVDRTGEQYTVAGSPLGADPLGGDDFDARLVHAVLDDLGDPELARRLTAPETPADRIAALDLRRSVRAAKETLSVAQRAHVRVPAVPGLLPDGSTVQVSREGFERLVAGADTGPGLDTAAALVAAAIAAAPAGPEVSAVFLVGGSSRIPLLGRLVAEATQRVPAEHGDPATAVAEGGAVHALDLAQRQPGTVPPRPPAPAPGARPARIPIVIGAVVVVALLIVGLAVWAGGIGGTATGPRCPDGTLVSHLSDCPPSAGTTTSRPAPPITCWDGTRVATRNTCTLPTGAKGMAWVYPTIDADNTTCVVVPAEKDVAEAWSCTFTDGTIGTVLYERWADATAANARYPADVEVGTFELNGNTAGTTVHAGRKWEFPINDRGWTIARVLLYSDYPYMAVLYARSAAELATMDGKLDYCVPENLRGVA